MRSGCRLQQLRIVIPHIPHAIAYRPGSHLLGRVGPKQVHGWSCLVPGIKPAIIILRLQDHWHSIVNWRHHLVGICGQDCEGLQWLSVLWSPALPQTSKSKGLAAGECNGKWRSEEHTSE